MPNEIELASVRLPGRESRWLEPPFKQLRPLVDALADALRPFFDRPFAFFGHSMGALVAYELTRRLVRDGGPAPLHLFVSGREAPYFPNERPLRATMPEAEFRAELKRLGGTPREVLENKEMMDMLTPLLRADFSVIETHVYEAGSPLECPITALGGQDDPDVKREGVEGWRTLTKAAFQTRILPGEHFFIHTAEARVLRLLGDELRTLAARAAPPQTWPLLSEAPPLGSADVHVWSAPLELPDARLQSLRQTLSADEIERAGRFFFERDRRHYIAGRGMMRELLGRYLGQASVVLQFRYTDMGKPYLEEADLRFNLAHSHGLAVLAVARGREVGVDVEYVRSDFEAEALVQNFFSPREIAALEKMPERLRRDAFFIGWTRKEAYLKGIGKGLSVSLDGFDVSLDSGADPILLETRHDPAQVARWTLRDLQPAPGYAAALAVEGAGWQSRCGRWAPGSAAD